MVSKLITKSLMQSPAKQSRVSYNEQLVPRSTSSDRSQVSSDAAELVQSRHKVAMLERELADSERTHQLR